MKLKDKLPHPVVFELRPDRFLIDPNFQGYKLTLETLPSYVVALETDIDHAPTTEDQYSLQQVKLSALTNHIFSDPWNPSSVYIVDSCWNFLKSSVNGNVIGELSKGWKIPESNFKNPGRFNVTLIFADARHAVVGDGCGALYILDTSRRDSAQFSDWKVIFQEQVTGTKKNCQFIVLDVIIYTGEKGKDIFEVLLLRIDERTEWKDFLESHQDTYLSSSQHPFVSVLEWLTVSRDESDSLFICRSRSLVGRSGVDYAAISENGGALYLASDDPFYFAYDSEDSNKMLPEVENINSEDVEDEKKSTDYVWHQDGSEVTLWFRLPEESKKSDFIIDISVHNIHIEYKKQVLLSGKFFGPVKAKESTWTLESGKLEIVLSKCETNPWSGLILDSTNGDEIKDPEIVDQIHSQLAHMCSDKWGSEAHNSDVYDPQQREECDQYPAETAVFMRIDGRLKRITNQASLDSHQWLFNTITEAGKVRSICVRHDVDAIVWQPHPPSVHGDTFEWNCKHLGTFSAFGYLQAAKERRKFTMSSPDFSYAVICDAVKHIYVYRQPEQLDNADLRNRKTGTVVSHIARQQVVALDPPLEVMGAYAGIEFLFILTAKNLHLIRVKQATDM